jgi:DHA1 family multidrug resistance protein-like MFS transporter
MKTPKGNLYILVFVLFVVMLGYGLVIPIYPFYIESMGAGGMELGLLVASYAVMRLIFGPIWGSISDRVGRKPILLIGILGYAVTMVWFGLATRLWMLFAARILSGVLSSATAPTTMAYIGDSTPQEERGGGMGLLGAAGGAGGIIGPAAGGFLGRISLSTPFFFGAGLALVALGLAVIFLPESHPAAEQTPNEQSRLIDLRLWWRTVTGPMGALFLLTFISITGLMIFANAFGLYALERFGYGPERVGVILMVLGLVSAVTQGALVGPSTKRWGDVRVIQAGLLANAGAFGLMLLASSYLGIILSTAVLALAASIQSPALIALTSRRATGSQGVAMGLSNSFVSLGRIVGPLFAGYLFDVNISLPYLSGAVVMGLGFVLSLVILARKGRYNTAMRP